MKNFSELVDVDVKQAVNDDRKIKSAIARVMPPESLGHVQFCRVENTTLKVTLDNAGWLARMRFGARQIINELHRDGISVTRTTWHVTPDRAQAQPRPLTLRQRSRSEHSANILKTTADAMDADELQRALLKVAEQLRKR